MDSSLRLPVTGGVLWLGQLFTARQSLFAATEGSKWES